MTVRRITLFHSRATVRNCSAFPGHLCSHTGSRPFTALLWHRGPSRAVPETFVFLESTDALDDSDADAITRRASAHGSSGNGSSGRSSTTTSALVIDMVAAP